MSARDEDELWRSIVANYGDRAELSEQDLPAPAFFQLPTTGPGSDATDEVVEDDEGFVPPPPPPLPRPDNKRLVAWIGVFGVPLSLLVLLLASYRPPSLVAYVMVAWFVGGFTYLVLLMPRGPRDPDDDGARL